MPARRVPSAVLKARGAFRKDPARGRARANEPVPTAQVGEAPTFLTAEQRTAWSEIVGAAAPGVLSAMDRFILERAAILLAESRSGQPFSAAKDTVLRQTLGALG
jgi:hypothetical protein